MRIQCLLFFVMFVFSGYALAQGVNTPRPEEVKVFHQCLQKAGLVFNDRVQCIGKVFDSCVMSAKDQSSIGMRECYSRETVLWEKLISDSEKKLRRKQSKATRTELSEAMLNWKSFRNNACNIPYTMYEGGTIGPVLGMECFSRLTALWALQLSEFATPMGN